MLKYNILSIFHILYRKKKKNMQKNHKLYRKAILVTQAHKCKHSKKLMTRTHKNVCQFQVSNVYVYLNVINVFSYLIQFDLSCIINQLCTTVWNILTINIHCYLMIEYVTITRNIFDHNIVNQLYQNTYIVQFKYLIHMWIVNFV
jgi:hypothetical protein